MINTLLSSAYTSTETYIPQCTPSCDKWKLTYNCWVKLRVCISIIRLKRKSKNRYGKMINDMFGACRVINNQHWANVMHFGNKTPTLPRGPVIEKKNHEEETTSLLKKKKKLALLGLCSTIYRTQLSKRCGFC